MADIVLTADRLFDGSGAATLVHPAITILGERIGMVESGLLPPTAGSGRRFHFPGCTILPGLIDTHVHLVMSALPTNEAIIAQVERESDEELLARGLANAKAALASGLTTVRDCGGRGRVVQEIRNRIRAGQAPGPD